MRNIVSTWVNWYYYISEIVRVTIDGNEALIEGAVTSNMTMMRTPSEIKKEMEG